MKRLPRIPVFVLLISGFGLVLPCRTDATGGNEFSGSDAGLRRVYQKAASDEDHSPLARDYKVRCQVGLVVHTIPDVKGHRVGTLENGQNVQLAGKKAPGAGNVFPIVSLDRSPGVSKSVSWIKIKAPLQGYILFTADENSDHDYIVPQVLGE